MIETRALSTIHFSKMVIADFPTTSHFHEQDQPNSPSNEKQINFDDFDAVGVDIAINGLPFKSTLQGFLASAAANEGQPLFGDELADFDDSESGNSANGRDKIKVEPLTESVRGQ